MAEPGPNQATRLRMLGEMGYRPLHWRGRAVPSPAPAELAKPAAETSRRSGTAGDPLWQALLRAAGAAHMDPATLGWEERLQGPAFDFDGPTLRINPIALRRQPQAKRALWKTLRALRRRLAERG